MGVSRRTMQLHKKFANENRKRFGLPALPPGPKFTDEASQEEAFAHSNLFNGFYSTENQQKQVQDPSGNVVTLSLGDFSPPSSHILSTPTTHQLPPNGTLRPTVEPMPTDDTSCIEPIAQYFPGFEENDDMTSVFAPHREVTSPLSRGIASHSHSNIVPSNVAPPQTAPIRAAKVQCSTSSQVDHCGMNFQKFMSWASENMNWIELGIDFALQHSVMRRVLQNVDAPYKLWQTIRRNIIKYSEVNTSKYWCCHGHELLSLPAGECMTSSVENCLPCTICDGVQNTFDL